MKDIVYFELNNWTQGEDYPDEEPFITWLEDDLNIKFQDEEWVKENRLCVVETIIDMSVNFCITATKEWVLNNCPVLLEEKYKKFIRYPGCWEYDFRDKEGKVYGRFSTEFLEYNEENIGITYENWS